jgi:hypothetical protein
MDELTLDGKIYVSSKRAAQITGYAKDYVGQLCREGRVEARQVGRNWYVLETSIREHRFGTEIAAEHKKEQESAVRNAPPSSPVSAWEAPTYSSEAVSVIPPIVQSTVEIPQVQVTERGPEVIDVIKVEDSKEIGDTRSTDAIVEEMQSAWKDWFTTKPIRSLPEEILLESPEIMDARNGDDPETPADTESEEVQVSINRPLPVSTSFSSGSAFQRELASKNSFDIPVAATAPRLVSSTPLEQEIASEEQIPLTRTHTSGMPENSSIGRRMGEHALNSNSGVEMPSGRIIKERLVTARRGKSTAWRVILILISLAAAGVAYVGSGYAENSVTRDALNNKITQHITGESSFKRD